MERKIKGRPGSILFDEDKLMLAFLGSFLKDGNHISILFHSLMQVIVSTQK